jgi:hypothetical protein
MIYELNWQQFQKPGMVSPVCARYDVPTIFLNPKRKIFFAWLK